MDIKKKYSGDPLPSESFWVIFEIPKAIKLLNFEVLFKMSCVVSDILMG